MRLVAGESAVAPRIVPRPPFTMALADDARCGVIPRGNAEDMALVRTDHEAVGRLRTCFDALWSMGVTPETELVIEDADRLVLALLADGGTDGEIGRKLHLSTRTVQRRVHGLMARLGARTRFQAGWYANRSCWSNRPGTSRSRRECSTTRSA